MLTIIRLITTLSLKKKFYYRYMDYNLCMSIAPVSGAFEMLKNKTKQETLDSRIYFSSGI